MLSDILNLGSLGHHFPSMHQYTNTSQPSVTSLQQNLSNATSGSYSTLNKIHNIPSPSNILGSTMTPLSTQELLKLNQNILSQFATSNLSSLYSTMPTANVGPNQQQSNSFMYVNQNAPGFNNVKPVPTESGANASTGITSKSTHMGLQMNQIDKQTNKSNRQSVNPSEQSLNKTDKSDLDYNQEGQSIMHEPTQFIKPLSQVGTLTTMDTDGKVKVIVPVNPNEQLEVSKLANRKSASFAELSGSASNDGSSRNVSILKESKEKKSSIPSLVTLKVTDESGTVTRRLPATPSFITRSTSEKVPNRSQIMSQVQRTQWARHTTK